MSELSKFPHVFVRHDESPNTNVATQISEHCKSAGNESRSLLLRNDHVVLWAIDGLLTLHAALVRWRSRRRTFRALADLNEEQLRDVGLTRGHHKNYQALAEPGDTQLCHLSEHGLRAPREVRRKVC
jgi:uncharacterized protein YjiS (DUF1127 family)